jgi:DNA-binding transcriptional ArsR family regulator
MPVVLLLENAESEQVQLRLSPLAELCATLHALTSPAHHPAGGAWAASAREQAPAGLIADCDEWAPLYGALRAQYFYPACGGPAEPLERELERIGELSMADFVEMTAAAILGRRREFTPAGLLRESWARRQFLASARRASTHRLALAERLVSDPAEFRSALGAFLRDYAERVFLAEWRRRLPLLRAELHAVQVELGDHGLAALARRVPGVAEYGHPRRLIFDKLYQAVVRLDGRPLLLLPSLHVAPHLVIKHQAGPPVSIQFPVGGWSAGQPSAGLVRERLNALADPSRLALLRTVLREPATTVDIAANSGMTEPQVSRHLRRLRELGLVRREREGRLVFYTLDPDAVSRIGLDLLAALRRLALRGGLSFVCGSVGGWSRSSPRPWCAAPSGRKPPAEPGPDGPEGRFRGAGNCATSHPPTRRRTTHREAQEPQPSLAAGAGAGPIVGRPSMTPFGAAGAAVLRSHASPAGVRRSPSGSPSARRWWGAA